jgi:hypothetical protein
MIQLHFNSYAHPNLIHASMHLLKSKYSDCISDFELSPSFVRTHGTRSPFEASFFPL